MKVYPKNKFWFLYVPGGRVKETKEGEIYFNEEYRNVKKFPFIKKELICYKLIGETWIEQLNFFYNTKELRKLKLKRIKKSSFSINNAIRSIIAKF
jgi:hypothetical protein